MTFGSLWETKNYFGGVSYHQIVKGCQIKCPCGSNDHKICVTISCFLGGFCKYNNIVNIQHQRHNVAIGCQLTTHVSLMKYPMSRIKLLPLSALVSETPRVLRKSFANPSQFRMVPLVRLIFLSTFLPRLGILQETCWPPAKCTPKGQLRYVLGAPTGSPPPLPPSPPSLRLYFTLSVFRKTTKKKKEKKKGHCPLPLPVIVSTLATVRLPVLEGKTTATKHTQ